MRATCAGELSMSNLQSAAAPDKTPESVMPPVSVGSNTPKLQVMSSGLASVLAFPLAEAGAAASGGPPPQCGVPVYAGRRRRKAD
jgi:hypothetical protein